MKNWHKEKSKISLVIDATMFMVLMGIAGLGLLMKYILVPGYKRIVLYDGDVELYFLGLTRHEWGSIHLWLSLCFLFLLFLHIILHWKMIACIFRQIVSGKALRTGIAVVISVAGLFLALAPLFVSPEVTPLPRKHNHRSESAGYSGTINETERETDQNSNKKILTPDEFNDHEGEWVRNYKNTAIEVYGYMTLSEVSDKYDIPVAKLAEAVDIPVTQINVRLGKLRKRYPFYMGDIKKAIVELRNNRLTE